MNKKYRIESMPIENSIKGKTVFKCPINKSKWIVHPTK